MKLDAMVEITETTEVHTVWFVGDGRTSDWMAILYRDSPQEPWQLNYRFRYYESGEVWPDTAAGVPEDRRSPIYGYKEKDPTQGPDKLLMATDLALTIVKLKYGTDAQVTIVPINGGAEKFAEVMQQQHFVHVRQIETEPAFNVKH